MGSQYPPGSALRPQPGTPSWLAATKIFEHQRRERPTKDIDEAQAAVEASQPARKQEEQAGLTDRPASAEPRKPDDERKTGGGHTATETKD